MSELIPTMTATEFKKLKDSEIRRMQSVEVISDGEHLFTAVIPHGDYIAKDYAIVQAEALGMKTNANGGLDPSELKETYAVV